MILVHLLDGKGRDEIAAMLHLSPETVKTHTRNIYQHFSVASQVELMRRFLAGNGGDIEMPG
jgi:DNA-binding NarL/FixJ family response regulator